MKMLAFFLSLHYKMCVDRKLHKQKYIFITEQTQVYTAKQKNWCIILNKKKFHNSKEKYKNKNQYIKAHTKRQKKSNKNICDGIFIC